ncbi:cation diffusion facilitator family transporter [Hyphomicrobium sp.]|jgi:cobalt-zinc-cadmium efflux system protein|uniref:cation diffusion facilitator family transporter n=1 Tax=Hyphomicrobium sp. TaxID=82 RepID=UPI003566A083
MAAHHDHKHDHDDAGGHSHSHAPANFGTAFAIGITLNLGFVLIEGGYGVVSNSLALIADAGHNLSDVLGLLVAWVASVLVKRPPSKQYTYGLRGSSILAALFNAVFLLVALGAVAWEAVQRLATPEPVSVGTVMVVAAVGIVINGVTAWLFATGAKDDINIRGAFMHMASDALISAGVVIAGLVIFLTGWVWLDPLVSLIISAVIVWGTWSLLRDSLAMSMGAVPSGINAAAVQTYLESVKGVSELHDLHIWPMSTTEVALTVHLVMPSGHPGDEALLEICHELEHDFKIGHATIQIETSESVRCALAPAHVV